MPKSHNSFIPSSIRQNGALAYQDPLVFLKIDNNNLSALEELNLLNYHSYNADLGLYEVNRDEIRNFPHLNTIQVNERQESFEEYEKRLFGNTEEQAHDLANRVYLDWVPTDCYDWVNSRTSGVRFDNSKKKYYLSAEDATAKSNVRFVQRCSSKRLVTAYDFVKYSNQKITPGMQLLADAFNMDDKVDRQKAISEAIFVLAKENVNNVDGAINSTNNLLKIKELARHGVNDTDNYNFSRMFWDARESLLKAQKECKQKITAVRKLEALHKPIPPELQNVTSESEMMAEAELKTKAHLHEITGMSFKKSLKRRLVYALNNHDEKQRLNLIKNVLLDYAKGHAICSEAYLIRSEYQRFLHNKDEFNAVIDNCIREAKLNDAVPKEHDLIVNLKAMAKLTSKGCEHADCACIAGINAKRDLAQTDFYTSVELVKQSPFMISAYFEKIALNVSQPVSKPSLNKIAEFDESKEPLFLRIDKNDFKNMPKELKDGLKVSHITGSLCVEDSEANREKYKNYLPEFVEQMRFERSYEDLRAKAYDFLKENGYTMALSDVKINEGWKTDKHDKSKTYLINLEGGFPFLQMYDFNGSLNKRVILSQPTEEERQKLKENAYKRALNDQALKQQEQNERSQAIRKLVDSLKEKDSVLPEKDLYFSKKGLSVTELSGLLYDKDGSIASQMMQVQGLSSKFFQESLIAPLTNSKGKVVSAQIITGEPKKLNAKGGSMNGAFFTCGGYDKLKNARCILVAEGVATAASIQKYAPPGTVVVACMSAHNMAQVALDLNKQFPNAALGLMADNDIKSAGLEKTNAGISNAYAAFSALDDLKVAAVVGRPPLSHSELESGLSDFNDAMQKHPEDVAQVVNNVVYQACLSNELSKTAKTIAEQHRHVYELHKQEQETQARHKVEALNTGRNVKEKILKDTEAEIRAEKKLNVTHKKGRHM